MRADTNRHRVLDPYLYGIADPNYYGFGTNGYQHSDEHGVPHVHRDADWHEHPHCDIDRNTCPHRMLADRYAAGSGRGEPAAGVLFDQRHAATDSDRRAE